MPALWASTQRSTWRHQRSPGSSPLKRISGRGVERSLPRERLNSRNSAVVLMQTRCATPSTSCVAQQPSRKNRSEEHTSELQSHHDLVCRLLLEKKKKSEHPDCPTP